MQKRTAPAAFALSAPSISFLCQKRILVDRRVRHRRLRAVVAVLGAEAALGVHQHVDLHALAEIFPAHLERRRQKLRQIRVRRVEHRLHLFACEQTAVQRFFGQEVVIHSQLLGAALACRSRACNLFVIP
jgi:hypothetical protein